MLLTFPLGPFQMLYKNPVQAYTSIPAHNNRCPLPRYNGQCSELILNRLISIGTHSALSILWTHKLVNPDTTWNTSMITGIWIQTKVMQKIISKQFQKIRASYCHKNLKTESQFFYTSLLKKRHLRCYWKLKRNRLHFLE